MRYLGLYHKARLQLRFVWLQLQKQTNISVGSVMEPDQKAEASTQASSSETDKQLVHTVPETKSDQTPQPSVNRSELIAKARTFLSTPHIRSQDDTSKHAFLVEKGLTQDEIHSLLREIVGDQASVYPSRS